MKNRSKKFKIIIALVGVYLVLAAALLGRERILGINQPEPQTPPAAAPLEEQKDTDNIAIDMLTRYQLPSLSRMEQEDQNSLVNNLQIIRKIEALGVDPDMMMYPEQNKNNAATKVKEGQSEIQKEKASVDFYGTTASELQASINQNAGKTIVIHSQQITLNQTITLEDNTFLQGNDVIITSNTELKYAFFAENKKNIEVTGVRIDGGFDYGVYVIDSSAVRIADSTINKLKEKPVVVIGHSNYISVENNTFMYNGAGGVYFTGKISYGLIANNTVSHNYGTSNWMAGIVLTNVVMKDNTNIWETFDAAHHFPYKATLYGETECPSNVIVQDNTVEFNTASGIYGDGAYLCYITGNYVNENDKEGICLDYGSFGCYLEDNTFNWNGRRINQTDEDLKMDFVLPAGRMEDGSSKSKLPGVSLDNTAYNILINNTVMNNYGGGVKMVRTTVRCLIIENIIKANNQGQNDKFHFFGVELGSAVGDVESTDMDFTADYENIICRNIISGNHYSGIFVGQDGYVNDIFDNVIMQPKMFAVECLSVKFNSIVNNRSDRPIRNEYDNIQK